MSKAVQVRFLISFIKRRRLSMAAGLCFALLFRPGAVLPAAGQVLPPAFDPAGSIAPAGSLLPGQVLLDVSSGVYTFTYSENAVTLTQYQINSNNNGVKTGLLKIRETLTNSYPIAYGGAQYRRLDGSVLQPFQLANTAAVQFQHSRIGDFARFDYADTVDGKTTRKIYDVTLRGKTLVVHAYAVDPDTSPFGNYSGLIFDRSEQTPNAKAVVIPYMELVPVVKAGANGEFFYSVYLDYSRSHSNVSPVRALASAFSATSYYNSFNSAYTAAAPLYPAFDETVYVTVSPYVQDLLMKIHRSQSPYRAALNNRVIADIWAPNFDDVRNNFIAKFRDFGMDNLAVINHNWQNMGYDCGLPSHYPANQGRGGSAEMKTLADYALNSGYLFALHQNYAGMNQNSPYWTSADISVSTDGNLSKAWNIPASCPLSPQAYWIAADKMVKYSDLEAPSIKSGYQANASYLDVTPTMSPAQLIDYSVSNLNSFTLEDALGNVLALNERQHAVFQGPLFGEGSAGSYQILQAGSVDGVEGEIPGREAAPVMPDFVLKQVKPLRADHGMGYHGRWLGSAGQLIGLNAATFPMDKYRATQIAYGRAGFMGHATLNGTTVDGFSKYWTKEFYTFRELQSQYLASEVQQILYSNPAGSLVDLNQALRDNVDFLNSQLKLTYANGLELYVNRHQRSTWTVTMGGGTYYLPPNGWAAINAGSGFLELSHLVNSAGSPDASGHRADFVKTPAYIMADGRGVTTSFGSDFSGQVIVSSGLRVLKPGGWKLTEQNDGSLLAVSVTAPLSGSVVSGSVTVTAAAASSLAVDRVVFYVDGVARSTDTAAPYEYLWDSSMASNGVHELGAMAVDAAGNTGMIEVLVVSSSAPSLVLGVHNVDVGISQTRMQELYDAGARLIRSNVAVWNRVEKSSGPAVFSWVYPDAIINSARAHGLDVMLELFAPPDYESAKPPVMPGSKALSMVKSVPRFKEYCSAVAQRYKDRVRYYEVWNEQNAAGIWFKGGTPADFVDIMRAAHEAVKAADPGLQVVMGGLVGPDAETLYASPGFFEETVRLGVSSYTDAYGIHYPSRRGRNLDWMNGLIARDQALRGGQGKPIWNTEENFQDGPGGIPKTFLISGYLQGAPVVVHYLVQDITGETKGLYDANWNPKPDLAEFGQIGRLITSRAYAGSRLNGPYAEFVFVGTSAINTLDFVVWALPGLTGATEWTSSQGLANCGAVNYLGASAGGITDEAGVFHVAVSTLPVYISCSAADRGAALRALSLGGASSGTLAAAARLSSAATDVTTPLLSITAPAPASVVGGTVTVRFTASDDSGKGLFAVHIDGLLRAAGNIAPAVSWNWNTLETVNGNHLLRVVLRDPSGNITVSESSVTVNNPLVGRHEVSNCGVSTGWVCDPDSYSTPVMLHFYLDGPAGKGRFAGWTPADLPREPAVGAQCGGGLNHGFSFATPSYLKDGQPHSIYAYAINIDSAGHPSGANPLLTGSSITVTCGGGVSGNSVISAFAGGSTITIRTTDRLAGAIGSLTWKGKEFINSWDHGREMQSASFFNGYGQSFNPNEAGSFSDGTGPASTSLLEALSVSGSTLTTRTRMAFWRRPGDVTAPYQPVMNTTPLSDHILNKTVRIGFKGLPNVIEYLARFTVPESYSSASFEAVTGYMPGEFSDFRRYNPQTHALTSLSDGPGGQPLPVIFSTPDKKYSMGIYSPDIPLTGSPYSGYSRYRFASADPAYATNKWNCLFRRDATPAGDYDFRCYVVVGTEQEVTASLDRLHIYFDTAAPSVSITAPADGSAASGQLVVSAAAADNNGVAKVEFYVDDVLMGTASAAPYSFTLDTTMLTNNAPARLRAAAYDAAGNKADAAVTVLIGNPVVPLPVNPAFQFTGAEEMVYDYSAQKCENWDFSDTPARAFRTADGKVSLISTSYKNYRLTGLSLNALGKDCHSLMPSVEDPAQFNYAYHSWLAAPYTEDGVNIYSLVHNEWYAYLADPKCTVARRIDGWVNSLTMAVSTDSAFSFSPPAEYLVAASSVPWSTAYPCSEGNSTRYGMFNPGNVIKKADGYYYAMYQSEPDPNGYLKKGQCLMRTRRLDQAAAWESWTGSAWDTSPNVVCAPIQPQRIESMRESITYNSYLNSYVLFGTKHHPVYGFFFSLSKDGFNWSAPVEVFKDTDTYYPSLLDPGDTSLNFENSGREAYLYYTRHNGAGLDRDLVRRKLQFTLPSVSITAPVPDAVLSRTIPVSAGAVGSFVKAELYVDGVYKSSDTVSPYQFSLNTAALADGPHTLTVSAYDGTGSTVTAQAGVFTHNAPPVISSAAAVFVSSYLAVLDWTTDEPATTRVEYGTSTAYGAFTAPVLALTSSHTVTLSGLARDTTYYWRARSVDAYGNGAIIPGPDFIGVTDRLVVTLGEPAAGAVLRATAPLLAYAAGGAGIQRVEFKVDGILKSSDTVEPYQYNLNTVLLADGGHTLTAWAYDTAGSSAAHSVAVSVHNIPPVISAAGVIGVSSFAAVCRWDTDEPATTRLEYGPGLTYGLFSANDVTLSTGHIMQLSGLSAGATYYWRARSIDTAGNLRVSTGPVFVTLPPPDTTPPVISGAAALRISSAGAVCAWRTSEPATARVEYGLTPAYGAFTPEAVQLSTGHAVALPGLLPDTVYYWRAISADGSGNEAALAGPEFATAVGADQVPPVITVLWPQPGAWLTGPAEIRAAATDNRGVSRVEFYLEGISFVDYSAPYAHLLRTLRLSNGTHTLAVRAFDSDGNTAEASVSFEVYNEKRIDKLVYSSGAVVLSNIANITVPPLAIASSAPVSIAVVSDEMDEEPDINERALKMALQRITGIGSGFRILPEGYVPGSPVKIKLPAGRGTRPAAALDEVLAIYAWDAAAGAWQALPSAYDAADNTVNAETSLFSVYALFSAIPLSQSGALGEVYVFPNPAKGGLNPVFHIETDTAEKVEIQIFDLTGRQVHKRTITSAPVLVNRNGRLASAYEYEWDIKKTGSGAYFYIVTVSAPSGKAVKKGKFAVIR